MASPVFRSGGVGPPDCPRPSGRVGPYFTLAGRASGKRRRWPLPLAPSATAAGPAGFIRASSAARQRGSSTFFQRPTPGFSALTAARIASRSASGSRSQAARSRSSRALSCCACASSRARTLLLLGLGLGRGRLGLARRLGLDRLGLIIDRGLIIRTDRGHEVAGGVLADPPVLVLEQPVEDLDLGPDPGRGVGLDQLLGRPGRDAPRLEGLDQLAGPVLLPRGGVLRLGRRLAAADEDDPPAAPLDVGIRAPRGPAARGTRAARAPPGPA